MDMKIIALSLVAVVVLVSTSCSVRGHAGRSSTGAGISTPIGGLGGAVRY